MRALLLLALWPALAAGQPVNVDDVVTVYELRDGRRIGIEETTEPPIAAPPVAEARRPAAAPARTSAPARQVPAAVAAAARAAPLVVRVPVPAREVAQASGPSFRAAQTGPPWHDGHNCPRCGTAQYDKAATYGDGSHLHTCPRCGSSWRHR